MKNINACSSYTLFESKRQNKYFYDQNVRSTQLCHPVLYHILKLHNTGTDVEQWSRNLKGDTLQLDGCGSISMQEIAYYLQKFRLLQENGFFSGTDTERYLSKRLSAGEIKSALANLRQVTYEVTDACSMNCAYCAYGKFYSDYDQRENKNLDTTKAKRIMDYITDLLNSPLNHSHHRPIHISFYGGEPLLNFPFIREMVDYVKKLKLLHNRFVFSMTTNGLLLEKYMDFLVEHDFGLLISLDGNERNNSYRVLKDGSPTYSRVLKNVKALKTRYPEYFNKVSVNFNAVFHNRNSVSDIHRFFKSQFNKVPSISELNPNGIKESQREEFRETYANVNESLHQAEDYSLIEKDMFIRLPNIQSVGSFIHQFSGFVYHDYNDLLYADEERVRLPTGTCFPFSRKIFITVNGKILPCERIGHQYSMGFVDEEKVELDYERVAAVFNGYFDKLKKQCLGCANTELCWQCIFYLDLEDDNPTCKGMLNREEFSQFLGTQASYLEEKPRSYPKIIKEVVFE